MQGVELAAKEKPVRLENESDLCVDAQVRGQTQRRYYVSLPYSTLPRFTAVIEHLDDQPPLSGN
jgi:hypothetical protein